MVIALGREECQPGNTSDRALRQSKGSKKRLGHVRGSEDESIGSKCTLGVSCLQVKCEG